MPDGTNLDLQLTAKSKELQSLMDDDSNLTEIEQVQLTSFRVLLEEFAKANDEVLQILNEDEQNADQEYWYQPKLDTFKAMLTKTEAWLKEAKQRLMMAQKCDEEVSHMDSISVVSLSRRKSAKSVSHTGSDSGSSHGSSASSASSSLEKEEATRAALLAKAAAIKRRQAGLKKHN